MSERLDDIRRAVEMTAMCKSVEWWGPGAVNGSSDPNTSWTAVLWCNAIGECVVGYGPDAWTAVQAAHALKAAEENRRG
jgi:hypothetical protein